MHPSAEKLNKSIQSINDSVFALLSKYGRESYFPALGIMAQAAEAKDKAKKYNATIGIATEGGIPMHLKCIKDLIPELSANEIFTYAPSPGVPALRTIWKEKLVKENPSLKGLPISNPLVTNALTHGLSLVGDLFIDQGDVVVLPYHFWENYELLYKTKLGAEFAFYDLYNDSGRFNASGFEKELVATAKAKGKAIAVLNFPNNPTGYSLYADEAKAIVDAVKKAAEFGNIAIVADDAYYSLFFEENMLQESLFAQIAGCHEKVLAIKIDGATKEEFVWGLRVGFITFGAKCNGDASVLYNALEQKTSGCLRASVSNISMLSQSLVLKALSSPDFENQKNQKIEIMKSRAVEIKGFK